MKRYGDMVRNKLQGPKPLVNKSKWASPGAREQVLKLACHGPAEEGLYLVLVEIHGEVLEDPLEVLSVYVALSALVVHFKRVNHIRVPLVDLWEGL